ncbi:MAG: hypothetical protein QF600_00815 [Verrucomicrobiota bacterium]|nr:hypothetical protein [Verrucomicrobiota bacterium]
MKSIDIKSLIIGVLLTSTILLGMAATRPTDKWDDKQVWQVRYINSADISEKGYEASWEVFSETENGYSFRRRIK